MDEQGLDPARLARIGDWMRGWVDSGKLVGMTVQVARHDRTVFLESVGLADRERRLAMAPDTVVRLYSMTKPVTSVALMMLYEEGRFQLDDPIAEVLPCFADMRVLPDTGGPTVAASRPITYRDLLTHTAGLSYGFISDSPLAPLYAEAGIDFQTSDLALHELVEAAATMPLLAHPGTAWNYSIATDILGHLVALHAGIPFEVFLETRILRPLGMHETGFHVPEALRPRFAANYRPGADGRAELLEDPATSVFLTPRLPSGGGGLVGTAGDYMRFCRFLLHGGVLEGTRLLGRKTLALMMTNHLGGDMASMGQPRFSESSYTGIGFGLGFSVMLDPAAAQIVGSPGECAWGGAASTAFWVDPAEDLAVVLLTQLTPSSTWPLRRQLRTLVYAALVD